MWTAFDGEDPMIGYGSEDDPGKVMLRLMETVPDRIGEDFAEWMAMRSERPGNAVRALFDPAAAGRLKEEYLAYAATYAENVGRYSVMYSDITIRQVDTEADV